MCVICDANATNRLVRPGSEEGKLLLDWIVEKGGQIVLGGRLKKESYHNEKVRQLYSRLLDAGRLHLIPDDRVESETKILEERGDLLSDDPHVLALARISGARILFSYDNNLGRDFKNKSLIDHPRGKIFKSAAHRSLLQSSACSSK